MRQHKVFQIPTAQPQKPLSFSPDQPWLAPLAGYSDLPFRLLCRQLGAAMCETEMISAKGLVYKSPGTGELLLSTPADTPLVIQLFGGEPESMASALLTLRQTGHIYFDCNMGCPVRKVLRQKAGAALMGDASLAMSIAQAMLNAAKEGDGQPARLGFKLRLGLAPGRETYLELGRRLEDAGAAWLTLHPRYASQGYGGQAHWEHIAKLAQAVAIPVIASGDLLDAAAGAACLARTGAKAVMYARGALHNPYIFRQHGQPPEKREAVSHALMARIIKRHINLTRLHCGDRSAFVKMRSIIPRYARFLPGVGELRQALCLCESWESLDAALDKFFEHGGRQ